MTLWAALVLLGGGGRANAETLLLITDPAGLGSNDVAPWVRSAATTAGPYPTINGLGTFAFSFSTFSVPDFNSLVITNFPPLTGTPGGLFVGTGISLPGGIGQTASFQVDAQFDFGPAAVRGFGFDLSTGNPNFLLRVYDRSGQTEEFALGPYRGFVGVTTDGSIAGFRLSASALESTATVRASEVFVNVSVPGPPGIVAVAIGLVCVGSYFRRDRKAAG